MHWLSSYGASDLLTTDFNFPIACAAVGGTTYNLLGTSIRRKCQLVDLFSQHGKAAQIVNPIFAARWKGWILLYKHFHLRFHLFDIGFDLTHGLVRDADAFDHRIELGIELI